MSLIAEQAGVAAGTIYCYFGSKEELINELYEDIEKRIMAVIAESFSRETSLRERFMLLGMALLRYFTACPSDFRYLEQFHHSAFGAVYRRDTLLPGKGGASAVFSELFKGNASKHLKKLPDPVLFALFLGPILCVARDSVLGFLKLDDTIIHGVAEACWDAIRR